MTKYIVSIIGLLVSFEPAMAQQTPTITCQDVQLPVKSDPNNNGNVTVIYAPEDLKDLCISQTNSSLTVVQPVENIEISLAPHTSQTIIYSVIDANGNTATGKITFIRQ